MTKVDTCLLCFTSFGALLSVVGVGGGNAWSDTEQHGMWDHTDDYVKREIELFLLHMIIYIVADIYESKLIILKAVVYRVFW